MHLKNTMLNIQHLFAIKINHQSFLKWQQDLQLLGITKSGGFMCRLNFNQIERFSKIKFFKWYVQYLYLEMGWYYFELEIYHLSSIYFLYIKRTSFIVCFILFILRRRKALFKNLTAQA